MHTCQYCYKNKELQSEYSVQVQRPLDSPPNPFIYLILTSMHVAGRLFYSKLTVESE